MYSSMEAQDKKNHIFIFLNPVKLKLGEVIKMFGRYEPLVKESESSCFMRQKLIILYLYISARGRP